VAFTKGHNGAVGGPEVNATELFSTSASCQRDLRQGLPLWTPGS